LLHVIGITDPVFKLIVRPYPWFWILDFALFGLTRISDAVGLHFWIAINVMVKIVLAFCGVWVNKEPKERQPWKINLRIQELCSEGDTLSVLLLM
jgi:hypothetical protein